MEGAEIELFRLIACPIRSEKNRSLRLLHLLYWERRAQVLDKIGQCLRMPVLGAAAFLGSR